MTADATDWEEDLPVDPEEEYRAFLRGLRRINGFGLFFVQCSPATGKKLVQRVRKDLPQKRSEVLKLETPIENLYELVENFPNQAEIDILFVSGLEHSLYDYELLKRAEKGWSSGEIYQYSWKGVPKILNHLNQQRDRFRDDFYTCFVFLIPYFVVDYFIHRAPDFFDWRSSFFTVQLDPEEVTQRSEQLVAEGDFEKYKYLTPEVQRQKILEFLDLLDDQNLSQASKADLFFELGLVFAAGEKWEEAISSWDQTIEIKPDLHQAWYNRGIALENLGRSEEAIAAYDKAIEIKPDYHQAWNSRGYALDDLGRSEEAIAAYEKHHEKNPAHNQDWNTQGNALDNKGRREEAI
ncbi:MAG: tetratricopeptide repeat protein, partial [Microcoleaceae cyanobacterium]